MAVAAATAEARTDTIRQLYEAENGQDFDRCLAMFSRPRYEIVATGDVYEGADAVMAMYRENATAFPDVGFETISLQPAGDGVLTEIQWRGTHEGPLRGLPPTGRSVSVRMACVFAFDDDGGLVNERVYFDFGTMLRQLGLARDPASVAGQIATLVNHPYTIGRAVARKVRTGRSG